MGVVDSASATKAEEGLVEVVGGDESGRMDIALPCDPCKDPKEAIDVEACLRAAGRRKRPLRSLEDASQLCRPFRREVGA